MQGIEDTYGNCGRYSLFTGKSSPRNMHFYDKLGYSAVHEEIVNDKVKLVYFEKQNHR